MIHPGNILNTFGCYEYLEGNRVIVDGESFNPKDRMYGRIIEARYDDNVVSIYLNGKNGNGLKEEDLPMNSVRLRPANPLERIFKSKEFAKLNKPKDNQTTLF